MRTLCSLIAFVLVSSLSAQSGPIPQEADWGWRAWGIGIGLGGMQALPNGNRMELALSTAGSPTGTYWCLATYDANAGGLRQEWVSRMYEAGKGPSRLIAGPIFGAHNAILVGRADGYLELWMHKTRTKIFEVKTPMNEVVGLAFGDLDGKPGVELLASDGVNLHAFGLDGKLLWSMSEPGGALVVANLDTDPALEIATGTGHVIDAMTRQVEWLWGKGFGSHLYAADIDNDQIDELVCGPISYRWLWCYDVDRQLPKWSIQGSTGGVNTLRLQDVDLDGKPDLLVGDAQWGSVTCFDALTQVKKWAIGNPEHGVTDVIAVDLDGDQTKEIVWGGGYTSSGKDQIYVADWKQQKITWSSTHVDGPFSAPVLGDVDGDGKPEILTASIASDAGYSGPRLLAFDSSTYALRWVSGPLSFSSYGSKAPDLQLVNLDGDKSMEIVVRTTRLTVYDADAIGNLVKAWELYLGSDNIFSSLFADLDGKPGLEVAVGTSQYLLRYDYATKTELSKSFYLGGSADALHLADIDVDNQNEIVVRSSDGNLYVFAASDGTAEAILQPASARTFRTSSLLPLGSGFQLPVTTDEKGQLYLFLPGPGPRPTTLGPIPTLVTSAYDSFTILDLSFWCLSAHSGRLELLSGLSPAWRSADYGVGFGAAWSLLPAGNKLRLLTSSRAGLQGFDF